MKRLWAAAQSAADHEAADDVSLWVEANHLSCYDDGQRAHMRQCWRRICRRMKVYRSILVRAGSVQVKHATNGRAIHALRFRSSRLGGLLPPASHTTGRTVPYHGGS